MFVCLNGPDSCLICPVFDIGCIAVMSKPFLQTFSTFSVVIFGEGIWNLDWT